MSPAERMRGVCVAWASCTAVLALQGCYLDHAGSAATRELDSGVAGRLDADQPVRRMDGSAPRDAGSDSGRSRDAGADMDSALEPPSPSDAGAADAESDATRDGSADGGWLADAGPMCPPGSEWAPTGCTDPLAMCPAGENVMFLSGSSWVHTGTAAVTGAWRVFLGDYLPRGPLDAIELRVDRPTGSIPEYYRLDLSTSALDVPLGVGTYEMATRHPVTPSDGVPGLGLVSAGRGCNVVSGRFQIHSFATTVAGAVEILASFDHYCEGVDLVRGCVRYDGPASF